MSDSRSNHTQNRSAATEMVPFGAMNPSQATATPTFSTDNRLVPWGGIGYGYRVDNRTALDFAHHFVPQGGVVHIQISSWEYMDYMEWQSRSQDSSYGDYRTDSFDNLMHICERLARVEEEIERDHTRIAEMTVQVDDMSRRLDDFRDDLQSIRQSSSSQSRATTTPEEVEPAFSRLSIESGDEPVITTAAVIEIHSNSQTNN